MAKYIEEQEILWRMNNALDEQDTYLPIHFKEMVIDECNPSDVIERSKIDKAIEEIEKSFEPIVGTYNGDTPERQLPSRKIERNEGRYQALEILIKLIE